jgi:hypothetical protein
LRLQYQEVAEQTQFFYCMMTCKVLLRKRGGGEGRENKFDFIRKFLPVYQYYASWSVLERQDGTDKGARC